MLSYYWEFCVVYSLFCGVLHYVFVGVSVCLELCFFCCFVFVGALGLVVDIALLVFCSKLRFVRIFGLVF